MKHYRMSLVISLALQSKRLTEMVYSRLFPLLLLREYSRKWVIDGDKSMNVGRDGTSEMIFLNSIIILL